MKPPIPENMRGALHLTIVYDPNAGILSVRLIEVIYAISKYI